MARNITKRRRTGKYDCKLYQRARAAESRMRVIIDAHDRCIGEREWRIASLANRLKGAGKIIAAVIIAAGGEVELNMLEVDELNERDVSIKQTGDDTFTYKYIGHDVKVSGKSDK